MNFLIQNQIQFTKIFYIGESFLLGFISNRLYKLIKKKTIKGEWQVLQLLLYQQINFPGFVDYPKYKTVLTCPTKGTVLAVKNL